MTNKRIEVANTEIAISVSRVTAMSKNAMKTRLQKPTCFTFHRKTKKLKTHTKNGRLSTAAQLAQHNQYHTALFPRVGAGGRGVALKIRHTPAGGAGRDWTDSPFSAESA